MPKAKAKSSPQEQYEFVSIVQRMLDMSELPPELYSVLVRANKRIQRVKGFQAQLGSTQAIAAIIAAYELSFGKDFSI